VIEAGRKFTYVNVKRETGEKKERYRKTK